MKTYIKIVSIALFSIVMAMPIKAQTARSAYFLEGVPTAHKLNPVLSAEYGYFSFPLLGNFNIESSSNVGVSNFMFPSESGQLMNFLNPNVSSAEFLDGLKSQNKMVANLDMEIFSFGFHKWNGFNTLNISLHTTAGMQVPKEIFEFLKVGRKSVTEPTIYQIRDINLNASSYAEIAFGHSHRINEKLKVGAKIKGLVGLAYANMNIDQMDITMDDANAQWIINTKGYADVAVKGMDFQSEPRIDENGNSYDYMEGFDFDSSQLGIAGGGLALDLGASYSPIKNLEITASVNDIGFITWNHNQSVETVSSGIVYQGVNMANNETFEDLGDMFSEMVEFKEVNKPSKTKFLQASLNVGAEYSFFDNLISLGVLSHTRFGAELYSEGMFALNIRAKKAFMMSLNGTVSNMGNSFGALLSICPEGFNLFLAVDCLPGMNLAKSYYLPVNKFHVNATLGLNFTFGKRHKWGI